MVAPCLACANGPSGIEGHGELLVQAVGYGQISFKCRLCEALWLRTFERGSGYVWLAMTGRMARGPERGIAVPPRSSSFGSVPI